ncbi:8815_t:CDS:1, partial [Racocetra fulgida]
MKQHYIYLLLLLAIFTTSNAFTYKDCPPYIQRNSTYLNITLISPQPPVAGKDVEITLNSEIANNLMDTDRIFVDLHQSDATYRYIQKVDIGTNHTFPIPSGNIEVMVKFTVPDQINVADLNISAVIGYWDSEDPRNRSLCVVCCSDQ